MGMKLNLGCGSKYVKGYINIDAPTSSLSDPSIKADIYSRIEDLRYTDGSIEGIKMDAVFEHFPRHRAIFLLRRFYKWLAIDGWIKILVPDFLKAAEIIKNTKDVSMKMFMFRHIFGPQDTIEYGTHFDGFDVEKLKLIFSSVGFNKFKAERKGRWPSIYFTAWKTYPIMNDAEAKDKIVQVLKMYTRGKKANFLFNNWIKESWDLIDYI